MSDSASAAVPSPPFNQCPAIGADTSCGVLIVINADGSITVVSDPSQGPFDGVEDTLVGVQNNSPVTVTSVALSSSTDAIFGFDGDGLCAGYTPGPSGCPFGATGYEGPNTSFTVSDAFNGTVNFTSGGIAPTRSRYFSLEGAPTATTLTTTTLALSPASATNPIGGTHTVTATLTTTTGSITTPVAGWTVHFSVIAGPNSGKTATGTTDSNGRATFTYSDTGGAGTDTIHASATSPDHSKTVAATGDVTKTWSNADVTAPSCTLTKTIVGPPKQIQVTVRDTGSGLASIVVTKSVNDTVSIPSFAVGTTSPVVVTATKINQSLSSTLGLQVKDNANPQNVTNCDPVDTTVLRGASAATTLSGIAQGEHVVTIVNGTPGLRSIVFDVNGTKSRVYVRTGQHKVIDIASALRAGDNNTVKLYGNGPRGGTAYVVIADSGG